MKYFVRLNRRVWEETALENEGHKKALADIQTEMDGVAWSPETLDRIATIMREAGYRIRDKDDADVERQASTSQALIDEATRPQPSPPTKFDVGLPLSNAEARSEGI